MDGWNAGVFQTITNVSRGWIYSKVHKGKSGTSEKQYLERNYICVTVILERYIDHPTNHIFNDDVLSDLLSCVSPIRLATANYKPKV